MKLRTCLSFLVLHSSFALGDTLEEDLKSLNEVRAERKANLQAIVSQREADYTEGVLSLGTLIEAKIKLHTFERETESSTQGKVACQEKIYDLETKRHGLLTRLIRAGQASRLKFMESKERLFAAKQVLLELKIEERNEGIDSEEQSSKEGRPQK